MNKETRVDIMRYKKNSISFWLCVLAIICNVFMFLTIYKETNCTSNWMLGIDLLVNVVFMLACFLLAEQLKAYNYKAGKVGIVIAAIEVLRIFWIPLYYLNKGILYAKETAAIAAGSLAQRTSTVVGLSIGQFVICVVLLIIAGAALVGASIIAMKKANELKAHLAAIESK